MKRLLSLAAFVMLLAVLCAALAEGSGTVAKVATKKGPLKMRAAAGEKGRVTDEIPNGTCLLVLQEDVEWCQVSFRDKTGYCKSCFLIMLREADPSLLDYRVLQKGDKGEDVAALKKRLQDLGYIRNGAELTNVYNDIAEERIKLFQKQAGITEDGIASQELQAYLFSEKAPVCGQKLPGIRSRVMSGEEGKRTICGCCMGDGCECCNFTGWITY